MLAPGFGIDEGTLATGGLFTTVVVVIGTVVVGVTTVVVVTGSVVVVTGSVVGVADVDGSCVTGELVCVVAATCASRAARRDRAIRLR
jgi:hypothetical protein